MFEKGKLTIHLMREFEPCTPPGNAAPALALPLPRLSGGMGLMEALQHRHSQREFATTDLRMQVLADLQP